MSRPDFSKTTGQSYSAAEWSQLKDKNNNPGLNDAWASVVKFDDEYYPDKKTMSAAIEYTIDATNAGTGNGRKDTIVGDGNTITFTGFTIRESDLTPASNVVTTVSGNIYTIVFIRVGSVSEVYLRDTGFTEAAPTLTSATIESASDDVLDFVFDEAVNITTAGWNIDTDGAALSISSVLSGSGTTTPKFQLSRSVLGTETLNVDYDSGTGNTVSTATAVELVTFTDTSVTNNVSPYDSDALALFARMATAGSEPDTARKDLMNTLILGLKTDGNWTELEMLQVYAGHAEAPCLLNWKQDLYNATAISAISFTVDRGFTGDAVADYIETGLTPSGLNASFLDDISVGVYQRDQGSSGAGFQLFGSNQNSTASTTGLLVSTTTEKVYRANSWNLETTGTSAGYAPKTLYSLVRTGAASLEMFEDTSSIHSNTTASVGLPNQELFVLAESRESAAGPAGFYDGQAMVAYLGTSSITISSLLSRLDTYLTSLGALP